MTGGFLEGNVFRGLAFRVLVFLSLALLPIGLIAVVQTREITRQSAERAELSLIGLTEQSSAVERAAIQEAFGVARALSATVEIYINDPVGCSQFFRRYQSSSATYSLVGFLPLDGNMTCSSATEAVDISDSPIVQFILEQDRRVVTFSAKGRISGVPVLTLSEPVYRGNAHIGFILISIPLDRIKRTPTTEGNFVPLDVLTFSASGEILTSDSGVEKATTLLPQNRKLALLTGIEPTVFKDVDASGNARTYSISPIVRNVVYAMSVWPQDVATAGLGQSMRFSTFLPVLMWLASLVVAFWALNRLAITHIRKLARQMRQFALNRTLPRANMGSGVPREILEMEQAFIGMADSIMRDEASLEDSLREKNILLKEVHHRVKNNLQLISSIMNMQIRQAKSDDARRVLRRLQERILSLATVHKNLYHNEDMDSVNGGILIGEIVNQLLVVGLPAGGRVDVSQDYENILMEPDDAAPLTLLVSEALTNALKQINSADPTEFGKLNISFTTTEPETAELTIFNTFASKEIEPGTGLGMRLINAFTRQLNGHVDIEEVPDISYRMTLTFPVPQQRKGSYDY